MFIKGYERCHNTDAQITCKRHVSYCTLLLGTAFTVHTKTVLFILVSNWPEPKFQRPGSRSQWKWSPLRDYRRSSQLAPFYTESRTGRCQTVTWLARTRRGRWMYTSGRREWWCGGLQKHELTKTLRKHNKCKVVITFIWSQDSHTRISL